MLDETGSYKPLVDEAKLQKRIDKLAIELMELALAKMPDGMTHEEKSAFFDKVASTSQKRAEQLIRGKQDV